MDTTSSLKSIPRRGIFPNKCESEILPHSSYSMATEFSKSLRFAEILVLTIWTTWKNTQLYWERTSQMASPDYEAAEVLWEMSSLAAPQSKGSENVMPGGFQTSGLPLNAAGLEAPPEGHKCYVLPAPTALFSPLSRGFTFIFLSFLPISHFLSIIKYHANICSLYFILLLFVSMLKWKSEFILKCVHVVFLLLFQNMYRTAIIILFHDD